MLKDFLQCCQLKYNFLKTRISYNLTKVFATLIHAKALYPGAFKPAVKDILKQYFRKDEIKC